jgi:RHS repeat-associated protein
MRRFDLAGTFSVVLLLLVADLALSNACRAQISSVGNDQAPPTAGVGHDYIHSLTETVNPANGSLSIRIQIPLPKGRQLTLPFGYAYDSSGVHYPIDAGSGVAVWNHPQRAGWISSIPSLDVIQATASQGQFNYQCPYTTGYIFHDSAGSAHALNMSSWQPPTSQCQLMTLAPRNVLSGSDGFVGATSPSAVNYPGGGMPPVTVVDLHGNVYYFPTPISGLAWVEDTNGNHISFSNTSSTLVETDTTGRAALTATGLGTSQSTMVVSGLSASYQATWAAEPYNFTIPFVNVNSITGCDIVQPGSGTEPSGLTALTLPNGQSFHFYYESVYGLLNEIVYPTGGWVKYTWGLNPQSNIALFANASGSQGACEYQYGQPVITKRQVSYDGTTVAEEQDFTSYTTTWNPSNQTLWTSKGTQVTTYDNVRGLNFLTAYTYSPVTVGNNDPNSVSLFASQVPVESQIVYHDWTGTVLQAVNETWNNAYEIATKSTTLDNGQTSKVTYSYSPSAVLVTETDEYDYGQSSPARKTVANYASFPSTPIYPSGPTIQDRPCQKITYDGGGNRVAETDYLYDNGSAVCGAAGTPAVSSVSGLPTGTHDETNYGPTSTAPRGNLTNSTEQCFPNCKKQYVSYSTVVTTSTYDETGQILSMTDPNGNTTAYSYADSYSSGTPPGDTNAYVTQITLPQTAGVNHVENFSYNFAAGKLTQSKDQNQQITTYVYNDPLGRPSETDYANGGQTLFTYNDTAPSVTTRELRTAGVYVSTVAVMDKMGQVIDNQQTSAPVCAAVHSTVSYDGMGHPYQVSNPYCSTSDPTYGLTTYKYDALGRFTLLTHPDSSTVQTTYTGRATEETDEGTQESSGSKKLQRISQSDALGRLTSVCEVSSTALSVGSSPTPAACNLDVAATGFLTTYGYDVLGNLTSVSQGGLNARTFTYNSLSRLICSASPEIQNATCPASAPGTYVPGTTWYLYDQNGNLTMKYYPKPNQSNPSTTIVEQSAYDALNRLFSRDFPDPSTPQMIYAYDQSGYGYSIGRLTVAGNTTYGVQSAFTYDQMGRVTAQDQCGPLNCPNPGLHWKTLYSYDLLGNILSSTNGMGVTISYPRNAVGQLTGITSSLVDSNHPATLISSLAYNAPGGLISGTFGGSGPTLSETLGYSSRLQLQSLNVVIGTSSVYSYGLSYTPNGDILSVNDSVNGNWSYLYDDVNRLASATQTGQSSYTNVYDRYGNRWKQNFNGACTSGPTFCLTFDNNNHVNNGLLTYDAAGNVTADNMHQYAYDYENRLVSVDGGVTASYVYDYAGNRVRKTANGVSVDYIYDLAGRAVTEVSVPGSGAGTWNRTEIFADGKHLATYGGGATGTTYFDHSDWLGTERARTNVSATVVERCTSLPFGDNLSCTGTDTSPLHFTGKDRDSESGLDHFEFRKFSSAMGRFMSPDPAGMMAADIGSPQTLNRYAYVLNNPLSFTDPFGLDCAYLNSSGTGIDTGGIDQNSSSGECGKTGGYWVDGTVTLVNIDPNATTISLTGTTNGTNTTTASYQQDAVVTVGEYNNTSFNPYHHVVLGLLGQPQFGQNPRSDAQFLFELGRQGPTATVPGQIKQQKGGQLLRTARIRATGMQSQMLQNAMNQSAQNPPPYTIFGATGCDCGTWVQMMLGDAGINAGPPTRMPDVLMDQLNQIYPQQPQPPQQ